VTQVQVSFWLICPSELKEILLERRVGGQRVVIRAAVPPVLMTLVPLRGS
jgi:hypothetical protein